MDAIEMNDSIKLNDAVFCALDFETTGINPVIDRIIEVGMVKFTIDGVIETYSSFINPERDIPPETTEIHGITDDMVKDAPLIESMLDTISEFIGDSPLIIQNPRFDLAFLDVAFKKCARRIPRLLAYDTVRLARSTFKNLPNYRLKTLCDNLNIEIHCHRALSDAMGCMEVFRHVVKIHDKNRDWNFLDLNKLHGCTIRPALSRKEKARLHLDNQIFIGDVVKIRYMDENGNITTRRILPKGVVRQGRKTYIYAYCYMRDDERYFNTGRILKVY